jgi:type III pantothenate kinase
MAVDVGNTQTVLGLIDGEEPRGQWRIATEAHRTSDELAVSFAGLLALEGLGPDEVSAMIVSSVVPGLTRSYRNLASQVFRVPYFAVTAEMETGLDNRYDDPGSVGADRIVNAVATGKHYGFPAIIVDIGTATTVEAVDGEACYLGGRHTDGPLRLPGRARLQNGQAPQRGPRRRTTQGDSHQYPRLHPQRFHLRLRRRCRRPDPALP